MSARGLVSRWSGSAFAAGLILSVIGISFASASGKTISFTNVSYDPTRELYSEFNKAFEKHWLEKTGDTLKVTTSHGGSSKQARTVIDGVEADVVTLGLAPDIDALVRHDLVDKDWQKRLPHNSAPYTSTIVLLVRKGNPKNIQDWDDLIREDIQVITPNPKTSAGARWNYLVAWEYAKRKNDGSEEAAKEFVSKLYKQVPVLDTGARGSVITFIQRNVGDVLITWENDAYLATNEFGDGDFEIFVPKFSILTEPTVSVVDKVVDRRGTREVAEAYLNYLYSDEGQDLAGRFYYRPTSEKYAEKYADQFPKLDLFTIEEAFGSWAKVEEVHFADGGLFDQIYVPGVR